MDEAASGRPVRHGDQTVLFNAVVWTLVALGWAWLLFTLDGAFP